MPVSRVLMSRREPRRRPSMAARLAATAGVAVVALVVALGGGVGGRGGLGGTAEAATVAVRPLPTGTDADYQLGGPAPAPANVGIVTRDRTAPPVPGRYNICYVNGFQTQSDERGFWRRHANLVLRDHGRPVIDENWGEKLLDLRTGAKRQALAAIMDRWVAGCARDGFAAVEFDNLDSYTRSNHLLTRSDAVAFARLLVASAHRHGLAAGQKNLAGFDGRTVGYDFAVAEECSRYDECGRYVADYGDAVIMIEYRDQDFRRGCRDWGARVPVVRRDLDLRPSYHPKFC